MLISEDYLDINRMLHKDDSRTRAIKDLKNGTKDKQGAYGAGGGQWVQVVCDLAGHWQCKTILDYGCGKASLGKMFKHASYTTKDGEEHVLSFFNYDPAVEEFSKHPEEPCDMLVCTDVMEHIEPECLDAVIEDMARLTNKIGFFVISTVPARKLLFDGRNAHLITEDAKWWMSKFRQHFTVSKFKCDKVKEGEFALLAMPK